MRIRDSALAVRARVLRVEHVHVVNLLGALRAVLEHSAHTGIAVASSASAALGAISEDGSLFGKSLIFVAMAEGIALYGLIISYLSCV